MSHWLGVFIYTGGVFLFITFFLLLINFLGNYKFINLGETDTLITLCIVFELMQYLKLTQSK